MILGRSRCFWVQEPLTSKTQPLIASILAEASWSESDNSVGRSWVLQFCQLGVFPQFIPFSFFHTHYSLLCGACLQKPVMGSDVMDGENKDSSAYFKSLWSCWYQRFSHSISFRRACLMVEKSFTDFMLGCVTDYTNGSKALIK